MNHYTCCFDAIFHLFDNISFTLHFCRKIDIQNKMYIKRNRYVDIEYSIISPVFYFNIYVNEAKKKQSIGLKVSSFLFSDLTLDLD